MSGKSTARSQLKITPIGALKCNLRPLEIMTDRRTNELADQQTDTRVHWEVTSFNNLQHSRVTKLIEFKRAIVLVVFISLS